MLSSFMNGVETFEEGILSEDSFESHKLEIVFVVDFYAREDLTEMSHDSRHMTW